MEDLMCLHPRPPAQHSLNVVVAGAKHSASQRINQRSELAISLRRTQLRRQSLNGIEAVSERAGTVMPPIPALTASMKGENMPAVAQAIFFRRRHQQPTHGC
jgi:3-polyprenyl-4-hydroxybenzoate decarboxylase